MATCVTTVAAPNSTPLPQITVSAPTAPQIASTSAPVAPVVNQPTTPVWLDVTQNVVTIPTLIDMPEVSYSAPVTNMPTRPTALAAEDLGTTPTIDYVDLPEYVDRALPSAPTITQVTFDAVPDYALPTFDENLPSDTLAMPTAIFGFLEVDYEVALLDYISAGLSTEGTGLSATTEAGLLTRSRARHRNTTSGAVSAMSELSSLFRRTMPDGAAALMVESVVDAGELALADHEATLHLKQADLRLEQKQFAWRKGVEYAGADLRFHDEKQKRLLATMKVAAEIGIKLFETAVLLAKARINAYNIASEVYASRIRAESMKLDMFKTEVEVAKMQAGTQKIYAGIYRTQLEGVQALVDVYKARMQTAQIEAEVQKLKLDVFKTAVDVYTTRVNAKATEGKLFEAQVRGETAKVQIYKAQADAYNTAVDAYRSKAQAAESITMLHVQDAEVRLEKARTQLGEYKAKLDTSRTRLDTELSLYKADVQRYSDETQVKAAVSTANSRIQKSYSDVILKAAEIAKDYSVSYGKLDMVQAGIAAEERIACAENTSKEMLAGVNISTAEGMALADIASAKLINTAMNTASETTSMNHIRSNELVARINLNANWYSGYNSIMNAEQAAISTIINGWNKDDHTNDIAILKANARKKQAIAKLTILGLPTT